MAFRADNLARVDEIEDIMDLCFKQTKEQIAQKLQDSTQNMHDIAHNGYNLAYNSAREGQRVHGWLELLMLSKYFEKIADHISAMAYA